jgi:SAM-dependent methyltransferase
MTDHNSEPSQVAEVWNNYWQGGPNDAASAGRGARHPIILSFWDEYFRAIKDQYETPKIIDIASGNGAIVNCAKIAFGAQPVDFTCLDVSSSAISLVKQLFPGVHGVVADAGSIPLDSGRYDIATSQFGIEYAGLDAIDEVTRLIAPGGQLALLLHSRPGAIYAQCSTSLKAIENLQESMFIPHAITLFEEGFSAVRGADRAKYEAAGRQFQIAIRKVESIFDQHGQHVADGTIVKFFNDILNVHSRIQYCDPSEVLNWLNKMQSQVQAFAGRMASMCNVAIDAKVFDELCERIRAQKFEILRSSPLTNPEDGVTYAWVLVAANA